LSIEDREVKGRSRQLQVFTAIELSVLAFDEGF